MTDERPSDVLGALPRRRPQRRSDKRRSRAPVQAGASAPANGSGASGTATAEPPPARARPARPKQRPSKPAPSTQPPPTHTTADLPGPARASTRRRAQPLRQPAQSNGRHIVGFAAQAAAELAGIGLSMSARAVRNAVSRLPRP